MSIHMNAHSYAQMSHILMSSFQGSEYKPLPYMMYNLIGSDITLKGRKKKMNPMIHRRQLLLLIKKSEMNLYMKAVFQDSPHF